MNSTKDLVTNGDVRKVIRQSLKLDEVKTIEEAYVARPKEYDLKTEMMLAKTKEAHLELYRKYVESLNDVSAKLDSVNRKEANAISSDYRALKTDEGYNMNAAYLHELYFANINDPYSEIGVDSFSFMRLSRDFGSFDEWQKDFIACAMSAGNGGWVITVASTYLKRYINVIVDDHNTGIPVGNYPVISLDCWEHARRDYLNDKKAYVIAMMKELNWNIIEERFKKADLILQVIQ